MGLSFANSARAAGKKEWAEGGFCYYKEIVYNLLVILIKFLDFYC